MTKKKPKKTPVDRVSTTGLHLDVPAKISATSLELPRALSYEDWATVLKRLAAVHDASNFWIGDALVQGNERYGEKYSQAASESGISEDRLVSLQYVASRVPAEKRQKELSWSFHREVAKLQPIDQVQWLSYCRKNGWSLQQLRDELSAVGLKKARNKSLAGNERFPKMEGSSENGGGSIPRDNGKLMQPETTSRAALASGQGKLRRLDVTGQGEPCACCGTDARDKNGFYEQVIVVLCSPCKGKFQDFLNKEQIKKGREVRKHGKGENGKTAGNE